MKLLLDWQHMKLDGHGPLHRSAGDLKFALNMLARRQLRGDLGGHARYFCERAGKPEYCWDRCSNIPVGQQESTCRLGASLFLSIRKTTMACPARQQGSSLGNRPTDRLTRDRR